MAYRPLRRRCLDLPLDFLGFALIFGQEFQGLLGQRFAVAIAVLFADALFWLKALENN